MTTTSEERATADELAEVARLESTASDRTEANEARDFAATRLAMFAGPLAREVASLKADLDAIGAVVTEAGIDSRGSDDTLMARIVRLIAETQTRRAPDSRRCGGRRGRNLASEHPTLRATMALGALRAELNKPSGGTTAWTPAENVEKTSS